MKSEDFIKILKNSEIPVFDTNVVMNVIGKSRKYTTLYIRLLLKSGKIQKIENGLYCLPYTDKYTIASRIVANSYISDYSALRYYKMTTQIPRMLHIISSKYHYPVKLKDNEEVYFSKVKPSFIYGYKIITNGPILADPEKIFIDNLYLNRRLTLDEEFDNAIKSDKINIEKLKTYAIKSNDKAVVSMLGHYLEKFGLDANNLLPFKSNTYLKLYKFGKLDKKWRIYE